MVALEEVLVTWSRLQSAVCELREDLEPSNAPHLIFRGTAQPHVQLLDPEQDHFF